MGFASAVGKEVIDGNRKAAEDTVRRKSTISDSRPWTDADRQDREWITPLDSFIDREKIERARKECKQEDRGKGVDNKGDG